MRKRLVKAVQFNGPVGGGFAAGIPNEQIVRAVIKGKVFAHLVQGLGQFFTKDDLFRVGQADAVCQLSARQVGVNQSGNGAQFADGNHLDYKFNPVLHEQ